MGTRSFVTPWGTVPFHVGPTMAKWPPLLPTVREPGACGTLFQASMICITQNRFPMSGTERTIGSLVRSRFASEHNVSTLKPTTVRFDASGNSR